MKDTTKWRTLHLWDFKSFLETAPRVGPLQKVLEHLPAHVENPRDYLIQMYYRGNLSKDLTEQFQGWMGRRV